MKLTGAMITMLAGLATANIGDRCYADLVIGTCEQTSWCDDRDGLDNIVGACPNDPKDVRCCVYPSCDGNKGVCMDTGDDLCSRDGGHFVSGKCPGPNNYKCCVIP